jgi:hypothetical protein
VFLSVFVQDDTYDQEQVHPVVFISLYSWTRKTSVGRTALKETTTTFSLGEEHPPCIQLSISFLFKFLLILKFCLRNKRCTTN